MNKLLLLFALIFSLGLQAQEETLSILHTNAALFHQTKAFQNQTKLEYIEENKVITYNAISIPFIDDFSKNTLKPYTFNENQVTDTIQYATGTCILTGDFTTENVGFHSTQAYFYFYDMLAQAVDSIPVAQIDVYDYSSATCFPVESGITNYWPSYYRSVLADFDTATGEKLDSTLVTPDVFLDVATIYFATMPDNVQWIDNFAWWNTTNPIEPLSIGVATLDGLNEFGLPYNKTVTNAYGKADNLTSKPIDLSLLGIGDEVYLSFFYQAGGLGDFPNPEDSLIVEFKGLDGVWTKKWETQGINSSDFIQAYIPIYEDPFDSLIYSNDAFQFRFRNYASLSGNNDLWNIDYVRLDKNRNPNSLDSVIRDVTVLYEMPNYLATYSMLPWRQMLAGADTFSDTISIPIRDNGQVEGLQAGAFPIDINISNTENADIIYNESGSSFNPQLGQEIKEHLVLPFTNFVMPAVTVADSFYFENDFFIAPINRNSSLENDTLKSSLLFHNVMAYDDGSAERAYGISGGGTEVKRFAYEFEVATQDTLAAIQIHFSNIDVNVSNLVFNLYAWDSLEIGIPESVDTIHQIGKIENQKPNYIDEVNGFATFVFKEPIIVNGKFYIGWAQTDNRNVQMGYDLNTTKGSEHMFVFTNNIWGPSTIGMQGSPMMRAILDGDYPIPTTGISNLSKIEYIKVFPNPASELLNIDLPEKLNDFIVSVMDFTGKQVYLGKEKTIDVSSFNTGMYMLSIVDNKTMNRYSSKFLVK